MLTKLGKLGKSSLLRSVAAVATGTALAQAITFVFMPLVTRLYGPAAFGVQSVFMSFASLLAAISALTLPMAIVLPRGDDEAYGLARLSMVIALLMSTLAALVLWLAGPELLALTNSQAIADYLCLLPPFMLFSALSATLGQWLIRKQQFRATASLSAWQALVLNGSKTLAGLVHPSTWVLVLVNTLGTLFQALLYLPVLRKCPPEAARVLPSPALLRLAKHYRDFPLLRAPQVLLNAASMSIPLLLFSSLFGPTASAFYSIAMSALGMPSTLIGNAVSQVFYPKLNSAALAGEDCRRMLIRATAAMAAAGLPIFAAAAIASPYLFGLVFGDEWKKAGDYAQWLSLWLFFAFINRPSVAAMPVLKLQGFFLSFELFSFTSRMAALYLGASAFESELATVICFSIAGALINAALIGCTIRQSGDCRRSLATPTSANQSQPCPLKD